MYKKLYSSYIDLRDIRLSPNGFISIHCPLGEHEDKTESAGFKDETGMFHCFSCDKTLTPAQFLSKIADVPLSEADEILDQFRSENDLVVHIDTFVKRPPRFSKRFNELYEKSLKGLRESNVLVQEFMRSRQIDFKTLKSLDVGLLSENDTHWGRESLVFPYLVSGVVTGIRYRDLNANKGGEAGTFYIPWGIDEIDKNPDVVVIGEGESDRIQLYQALSDNPDISVISTPTASFSKSWAREFQGIRQVIIVPDSDEAGENLILACKQYIGDILTIVDLPWGRREFGKDVCDWTKIHGEEELKSLITSAITPHYKRILSGVELSTVVKEEKRWLVKGLIGRRQACIIGGQPKSYKTWIVLNLVRCLMKCGTEFCGITGLESVEDNINVLIFEEEGNIAELEERANMTLKGTDWKSKTFWAHRLGIKLDDPTWITRIKNNVRELGIDVLIIDPYQKTHSLDENDAGQMGKVWNAIAEMLNQFPELTIILLHHFKKSGEEGLSSLRGSSRMAAETDLLISCRLRPPSEPRGAILTFEGRSIEPIVDDNGSGRFRLTFKDGIMEYDTQEIGVSKHESIEEELITRGTWELEDCAKHYGKTVKSVRRWIDKSNVLEIVKATPSSQSLVRRKK